MPAGRRGIYVPRGIGRALGRHPKALGLLGSSNNSTKDGEDGAGELGSDADADDIADMSDLADKRSESTGNPTGLGVKLGAPPATATID